MTGALATSIVAGVHENRTTPPGIANTDGDPMCLITATIAVSAGVAEKLAAHRDFGEDADDPSRIT